MLNKKVLPIVLASLFLLLAACGRNGSQNGDGDVDIRIIVAVESTSVGETNLVVTLTDTAGTPIDDATVSVKGDMSHAGMVPVLAEASGGENGVYEMSFEWTMGGDWVVTVEAVLPDGRSASQQFNFTIDS